MKISCDFAVLDKIIRYRGRLVNVDPSGGDRLLDTNNIEIQAHQSVRHVFCRGVEGEVAYHGLYGLQGFGLKVKFAMIFVISLVPFLVLRNSKLSFTRPFICFCN
jgi:hypothetical protein